MTWTTEILIPYQLANFCVAQRELVNKYETNQVIKALDTWLVLKHATRPGWIQNWNLQKKLLVKICKISETILRHRLRILQDLRLIDYDTSGIRTCSWEKLERILQISCRKKYSIKYTTNDKKRIQEWIIATDIVDNQAAQTAAIISKLNKNPQYKKSLTDTILKSGGDATKLNNSGYLLSWMRRLYMQDFIEASELHDLMIAIRPDHNRGVKGMKKAWHCKHACTISYWKNILKKAGIIFIQKLQLESFERVRHPFCHVIWLKDVKQTMLCLCDDIEVMRPWERLNLVIGE